MSTGQNKIYYNVNIPYKAEEKVPKAHFYSKAETEIRLNGPLITDPMNYDLAISKFKIDAESIPMFIPELKHPKDSTESIFTKTGEVVSNYTVTLYFHKMLKYKTKYEHKRRYPVDWLEYDPDKHKKDETKYEYKEEGADQNKKSYYRGKMIHPIVWTNVDVAGVPHDKELYEYKNAHPFNKYRLIEQEPRVWTPIPPYHQISWKRFEYWTYNGHNHYR